MVDKRSEMQKKIESVKNDMVGYRYRHFKGAIYIVKDIAIHSETAEPMVIYTRWDEPSDTWCRPLDMFCSEVDHEKYPEVAQKFRFERMTKQMVDFNGFDKGVKIPLVVGLKDKPLMQAAKKVGCENGN